VDGLKHQKEKRSMDHFAGLDVSVKETSVCIVDDTGRIVREVKVASEPEALLAVLESPAYRFKRIGLEAGPLSQWLYSALAEAGLPVICVETWHMRAVLKAQINKTDRNDAELAFCSALCLRCLRVIADKYRFRLRVRSRLGTMSDWLGLRL
jgi:transposase